MSDLKGFWTGEAEYDYTVIDDLLKLSHHQNACLDLGCGCGRYLTYLARRYRVIVGVEIDPRRLAVAAHCKGCSSSVFLLRATVENLPIASNSVSAVLAWGLLCQLCPSGRNRSLRELARVLEPNGVALLGICGSLFCEEEGSAVDPEVHSDQEALLSQKVIAPLRRGHVRCDVFFRSWPNFWTVRGIKETAH